MYQLLTSFFVLLQYTDIPLVSRDREEIPGEILLFLLVFIIYNRRKGIDWTAQGVRYPSEKNGHRNFPAWAPSAAAAALPRPAVCTRWPRLPPASSSFYSPPRSSHRRLQSRGGAGPGLAPPAARWRPPPEAAASPSSRTTSLSSCRSIYLSSLPLFRCSIISSISMK